MVSMERVKTDQAAKELNVDVLTLQHLLRQRLLPIGFALKKDGKSKYSYVIYRQFLDAFKETGKDPCSLWGMAVIDGGGDINVEGDKRPAPGGAELHGGDQ